ncbi:hypothetical protein MHYP_G00297120 [Metynnis hypsauchen]
MCCSPSLPCTEQSRLKESCASHSQGSTGHSVLWKVAKGQLLLALVALTPLMRDLTLATPRRDTPSDPATLLEGQRITAGCLVSARQKR